MESKIISLYNRNYIQMRIAFLITGFCFFMLSLYAKKRVQDKLFDAYHNNDSYGQGLDYRRSEQYKTLIKLSILLGFLCLAFGMI